MTNLTNNKCIIIKRIKERTATLYTFFKVKLLYQKIYIIFNLCIHTQKKCKTPKTKNKMNKDGTN